MHLIFSRTLEFPTNRVLDWLYYYNKDYKKYTGSLKKEMFKLSDTNIGVSFGGKEKKEANAFFKIDEVPLKSVWFRTPNHNTTNFIEDFEYKGVYPKDYIKFAAKKRFDSFWEFLGYQLEKNPHLGSFKTTGLNKPITLLKAQECGLMIPKSLVTNSREQLNVFFNECNKQIITKSIHEVAPKYEEVISDEEQVDYIQLTHKIENLNNTPSVFAPSFFQEYIDKEFEIRTTFLKGGIYSGAIFTQMNDDTKVDMRNRDANVATRYIPYELPNAIKEALSKLMQKLELNFGVVDFIKSTNGEHYFLEVNPLGQYGDISINCNYNLHKKIAEILINESK